MFKSSAQGFGGTRNNKRTSLISSTNKCTASSNNNYYKPKQTGFSSLNSSMSERASLGDSQNNKSYCFGGVTYQCQNQRIPPVENGGSNNNRSSRNGSISSRTFDPFFDRGKYRTPRARNSIQTEDFERRSSAVRDLLKVVAAPILNKDVHSNYVYSSQRAFEQALEYYNRLGVSDIIEDERNLLEPVTWSCRWHWVQKGCVRASQQMCIQCRDLGKKKSMPERYYLNVVEVAVSRTILCHKCMGLRLKQEVGDDTADTIKKLKMLREKQVKINKK